ncbi:MAG: hypothetical protein SVW57_05830, partial [Thermodesulfobacteriota bacterium]|nr:hypothetical protein [Thermodesulfobacteriota bacterium]
SGTGGVLAADACNEFGLRLAHLSDASLKKLKEIVPSWAEVKNPVDVGRVVDPEIIGRAYPMVLEAFLDDPNVDAILVMAMTVSTQPEFSAFDVLREFAESDLRKPIVVTGLRDAEGLKELATLEMKGIVAFSTVRRAVKALAVAYSRHRFLNQ